MTKNINPNEKRIITNEDLHDMIVDSFDRFFIVMDENTKEIKSEFKKDISDLRTELKTDINDLRSEIKSDIFDLKNDMNQRFVIVDKQFMVIGDRLLGIENNMVYRHQIFPKFA
jgi:DNA replicative helicase MCM subunit Mcm2 (Cdc46/Mcm family)